MKKNAFTLIELLIAISIISVLSVIGLVVYKGVQSKTRDSIRKQDLNKLAMALEVYAQQHNGKYIANSDNCTATVFSTTIADYLSGGIAPQDPQGRDYCYISTDGLTFTLCANLENQENSLVSCPLGYNYGIEPN
ncbi:type II secretion system protein [Candidatus Daviesbacteria bacterium]|nr:type II secretion system protein [Candidatus Daviesbacteria bacterium]